MAQSNFRADLFRFSLVFILVMALPFEAMAQTYQKLNTGSLTVGANTAIDGTAVLDARSTTKGVLLPRMTTTQKNAISSPTDGLLVYDSTTHFLNFFNGSFWLQGATLTGTETLTNKTLTTPIFSSIFNGGTLTLPTGPDTLVGRASTDTLTNKTLTLPVISSISNSGTLTLPTGPDTLVGRATTDTLTNKTLTLPVISSISNSGTLTLPLGPDTLVGRAATDTLTNKTLTLPVISSISNSGTLTLPLGPDTLVGRASTDTLTNKTLTAPIISTISNSGTLTLPTGPDTLVGRATTDTLTNKTLTNPVQSAAEVFTQITTPANPAAGTNKLYVKADNKFYTLDPTGIEASVGSGGGGGGSLNYILNPDFETAATGYATYNNAAGVTPGTGTGGSPVVTFARTTTAPLRGTGSGLLTKGATNRQGDGFSYDITIDTADQGKVLNFSFDYTVVSGTYADADVTLWIYDKTNSVLIQPSGSSLLNVATGFPQKKITTFQTSSNSTSYRAIWHVSSVSALAYSLLVDNVVVGPQLVSYGVSVTDWAAYTPTFAGFGTTSGASFFSRRVGDSLEFKGIFTTGTTTGVTAAISLGYGGANANVTTDASKTGNWITGKASINASSTTYFTLSVLASTGSSNINLGTQGSTTNEQTAILGTGIGAGSVIELWGMVPISGWSSSVVMSNDTDTRVVALSVLATPTSTVTGAYSTVTWAASTKDSAGAFSPTTGIYTVPVPGWYQLSFFSQINGTSTTSQYHQAIFVRNNASAQTMPDGAIGYTLSQTNAGGFNGITASGIVYCNAGDTLKLQVQSGVTSPTWSTNGTTLSIYRLSGPSQIAATESVNAKYTTAAGQAITNGSTTTINFDTKVWDSHAAVTTGASWKYTAPISGKYRVNFAVLAQAAAGTFQFNLVKNGSTYSEIYRNLTSNQNLWTAGEDIDLLAGDYFDIRLSNGSGGTITLNTNAQECRVSVSRIGN
jgi:hypothetical protein